LELLRDVEQFKLGSILVSNHYKDVFTYLEQPAAEFLKSLGSCDLALLLRSYDAPGKDVDARCQCEREPPVMPREYLELFVRSVSVQPVRFTILDVVTALKLCCYHNFYPLALELAVGYARSADCGGTGVSAEDATRVLDELYAQLGSEGLDEQLVALDTSESALLAQFVLKCVRRERFRHGLLVMSRGWIARTAKDVKPCAPGERCECVPCAEFATVWYHGQRRCKEHADAKKQNKHGHLEPCTCQRGYVATESRGAGFVCALGADEKRYS